VLGMLRHIVLRGQNVISWTLAITLLLAASFVYAGPTSIPLSSESDDTVRVTTTSTVPVIIVVCHRSHFAWDNWYAYAGGDPVNRWDPSGLDWEWVNGQWEEIPGSVPVPPMA